MPNFSTLDFFRDYSIPHSTGSAKSTKDYANSRCPHCGASEHLGWHLVKGYTHCWKCGHHQLSKSIEKLLGIPWKDAQEIIKEYEGFSSVQRTVTKRKGGATSLALPGGDFSVFHRKYLEKRGFDVDQLIQEYGLTATGPGTKFQGADYELRVIIPLYDAWGRLISFQGRDITDKHKLRYKVCSISHALMHYKDTLYNQHKVKSDTVVLVEGVVDVWRGGKDFVCSYGTAMTSAQVRLLADYKRVFILFDNEPEAQGKAMKYGKQLASIGVQVENLELDLGGKDPGDLTYDEARQLRSELGLGNFL